MKVLALLFCLNASFAADNRQQSARANVARSELIRVAVSSVPQGARIEIGYAASGPGEAVPCGITTANLLLQPGEYRIKLTLRGFAPLEQNFAVRPGVENVFVGTLQRLPVPKAEQTPIEPIPVVSTTGAPPSAQAPKPDEPPAKPRPKSLSIRDEDNAAKPQRARTAGRTWSIVEIDYRVTESNDTWWRYAWKLTLRNDANVPRLFGGDIEFQDSDGFVIATSREYDMVVPPGEEKTFTGFKLITARVAGRVSKAQAKVAIRSEGRPKSR